MASSALTSKGLTESRSTVELEGERETRLVLLFLGFVGFLLLAVKAGSLGFGLGLAVLVLVVLGSPRGNLKVDLSGVTSPHLFGPQHFPASEVEALVYDRGKKGLFKTARRDPSLVVFRAGVPVNLPTPRKSPEELEAFVAEANRVLGIRISIRNDLKFRSALDQAQTRRHTFWFASREIQAAISLLFCSVLIGGRELAQITDRSVWVLPLCLLAVIVGVLWTKVLRRR